MAGDLNDEWGVERVLLEVSEDEPTHRDHAVFFTAIHERLHVWLTWNCITQGCPVGDLFVPLDFKPSSRARDQSFRYHFFDEAKRHPFPVLVENVLSIELDDEPFDPANVVPGPLEWYIKRDWLSYD